MAKKPAHPGGPWRDNSATTFGKARTGAPKSKPGTGSGNKQPLVDQARQANLEFEQLYKQVKQSKRGRLG
jgi:hypothetical protein